MSYYEILADSNKRLQLKYRPTPVTVAHFHSACEFLFSVHGGQEVVVGGERRVLQAGEACFSDGYVIHAYTPNPTKAYLLLGDKRYFEPTFAALGGKVPPPFFRFDDFSLLDSLCALFEKDMQNEAGRYELNGGIVKILLAELVEKIPFQPRKTDKQSDLVNRILRYAAENLSSDLSLGALSETFGYSYEHLSRLLRKYLCEGWSGYVGRLRARKAEELFASRPESSVLDVAFECGFDSPNTFYRAYKKEFGEPPKRKL